MFRLTRREQAILTGFLILILIVSGIYMYGRPSLAADVPLPKLGDSSPQHVGNAESKTETPNSRSAEIKVDVKGAVQVPGVYTLPAGSRIADALQAAGGAADNANLDALNLAQKLADGMSVLVSRHGEPTATAPAASTSATAQPTGPAAKINVNTATEEQLDGLNGIGSTRAKAIVQYREQFGPFQTAEDLLKVKGVGPKLLETIKDRLAF